MMGRKSTAWLFFVGAGWMALGAIFLYSSFRVREERGSIEIKRQLVKTLGLTDLCIFTDARYTRHPVMADLFTPFQDHPLSLEHFPSASLMGPPPHLTKSGSVTVSVGGSMPSSGHAVRSMDTRADTRTGFGP
jgi:hypothetical protein